MLGGGADARVDRAFERLYRRHVGEVYRYACAVLGNRADAEDVTQTAFLNAYRAFRSGTRPDAPLNWLIAITHNVCRQRFRDGSRRPREVGLGPELAFEPVEDERFGREDILRAFSQLSLNQRAALAMRELEGRSYAEIGSVLGLTKAAVETLVFRARRSFREQLEGSLTCNEAEQAISLQLDGMLARGERGGLRAHLRACPECASLARRYRAQRSALRGIGLVPVPSSLAGGFGLTGSSAVGTAIGAKALALGAAALVAAGVGTEVAVTHTQAGPARPRVEPVQAIAVSAEVQPAAALASAQALLVRAAATQSAVRPIPATVVQPTSRAASSPPAQSAPTLTAEAKTGTRAVEPVAAQAIAPERDSTTTRQQPQLSGGGQSTDGGDNPGGPAVGKGRHQPPGQAVNAHASTPAEHPQHPDHPVHPEHPAHPDNSGQAQGQDGQTAAPPADPPVETPTVTDVTTTTVTDVTTTTVSDPASDHPGNGTPPAEPPGQVKPKPPKSGGNPHDVSP